MITLDQLACRDLHSAKKREWLVTNGIGGYASSTVAGLNSRRYHGLLIAATKPPLGRFVLLSQLEDAIVVNGVRFDLSTNMYLGDIIHPAGHLNLKRFELEPYPQFVFGNDQWELRKSIFMPQGENTTVIDYQFQMKGDLQEASLEVRPLIAFRDYHSTTHENESINRSVQQLPGCVGLAPYEGLPTLYLSYGLATVQLDGYWYRNFKYQEEQSRGLDFSEDLYSPLVFKVDLKQRPNFPIIASVEPRSIECAAEYRRAEEHRSALVFMQHRHRYGNSELIPTLHRAAEQFIATRAPYKTLLAGFHWFGDWGRDTMIALPGLLLATDRPQVAKEILLEFVQYVNAGMLPNRFPDQGEAPEYNTADATLWFFEALRQYHTFRDDEEWRDEAIELIRSSFYAPLKSIVQAHLSGTRFGIHVDVDGFLWAGDDATQLTWMDAKVGDIAITPRAGRPVELQALWYNALKILESFGRLLGDELGAISYAEHAARLEYNFQAVFWNEPAGCLYDVAGKDSSDSSLRPNQIFTISLPYPLLKGERAQRVVDRVERELLTPFGLRTLSPKDPHYRGRYEGDVWNRDSAYHQGTVWPWLAGPFFSAKLRASDTLETTLCQVDAWLAAFTGHLREAGIGQIAEIFDGDYPHNPRGCIAQAWSVAEVLRIAKIAASHPNRRKP